MEAWPGMFTFSPLTDAFIHSDLERYKSQGEDNRSKGPRE